MEKNKRLEQILARMAKLNDRLRANAHAVERLTAENKTLKEELEKAKKINFETNKKVEIANMASQLSAKTPTSQSLKQRMDKYIREVDQVIEALKQMDE